MCASRGHVGLTPRRSPWGIGPMKKRWLLYAGIPLLVGLVFVVPPSRLCLLGWVKGEPCYQGMPLSYWRYELNGWEIDGYSIISWSGDHKLRFYSWYQDPPFWEECGTKWGVITPRFLERYGHKPDIVKGERRSSLFTGFDPNQGDDVRGGLQARFMSFLKYAINNIVKGRIRPSKFGTLRTGSGFSECVLQELLPVSSTLPTARSLRPAASSLLYSWMQRVENAGPT